MQSGCLSVLANLDCILDSTRLDRLVVYQVEELCKTGGHPLDTSTPAALSKSLAAACAASADASIASLVKSLATRAMSEAEYFSTGEDHCCKKWTGMLAWRSRPLKCSGSSGLYQIGCLALPFCRLALANTPSTKSFGSCAQHFQTGLEVWTLPHGPSVHLFDTLYIHLAWSLA